MFSFTDLRGESRNLTCGTGNTLMDQLDKHPEMTKFKSLVEKVEMRPQLTQPQANFTLFVPLDKHVKQPKEFFDNLDRGFAKQIVSTSTLPRAIPGDLIRSSPVSLFKSMNSDQRLYITNINDITQINNCARIVLYDIKTDNGIIHVTDEFIVPVNETFIN